MVGGTRTPEEQRGGTLRSIRGFAPRAPSRQLPREQKRANQSADDGGPTRGMAGALNRPNTPFSFPG